MIISLPEDVNSLFTRLLHSKIKSIALVFMASAIITSTFLLVLPSNILVNESSDYTSFYKPVALSLLNDHGLVDARGRVALRYPPGYPIILAGLFGFSETLHLSEKTILTLFAIFCMGMATVFIFLISKTFWGPTSALISAAGFATYPFALWLTKQPNVELPFFLFFFGGLWVFVLAIFNKPHPRVFSFISGVLLGGSMLIRPIAIGLPLVLICIIMSYGHKMRRGQSLVIAGFMLLGVIVLVLPWELWVYFKNGKVILLSSGGVPSILDGLTFGVFNRGYRQGVIISEDIQAVMRHFMAQREQLGSIGSIVIALLEEIKEQPLAVTKLFVWKALRSWYGTDSQKLEYMIMLAQGPYMIAFLWTTIKCLNRGGNLKLVAIAIWLIVMYFWMMSVVALPLLRYMVPTIGLLFVLFPVAWENKLNYNR